MRSFLLGLAGGFAAAWLAVLLVGETSPVEASEIDIVGAPEEWTRLEDKIARLEAQLASQASRAERESEVGEDKKSAEAPQAPEPVEASAKTQRLLRELDRLIASGLLAARFEDDDEDLFEFLVDSWVAGKRPEEALMLLQVFRGVLPVEKHALGVANALASLQKPALAVEAYLLALSHKPSRAIQRLSKLAPERALAALDDPELIKKHGGDVRLGRIQLLAALGRVEEVFADADAQLQAGKMNSNAWKWLISSSASEAEKRLRAQVAKAGSPKVRRFLELQLVDALSEQGRREDAVRMLVDGLGQKYDAEWVSKLGKLDSARSLALLARRTQENPRDSSSWNLYGKQLIDAGRKAEAYQVLERALARRYQDSLAGNLIRADPLRAAQRLEARARNKRDDELLGDMADGLWKAGHRQRALRYYEEALRYDSDDSEWVRKTRLVREGKSPFRG